MQMISHLQLVKTSPMVCFLLLRISQLSLQVLSLILQCLLLLLQLLYGWKSRKCAFLCDMQCTAKKGKQKAYKSRFCDVLEAIIELATKCHWFFKQINQPRFKEKDYNSPVLLKMLVTLLHEALLLRKSASCILLWNHLHMFYATPENNRLTRVHSFSIQQIQVALIVESFCVMEIMVTYFQYRNDVDFSLQSHFDTKFSLYYLRFRFCSCWHVLWSWFMVDFLLYGEFCVSYIYSRSVP